MHDLLKGSREEPQRVLARLVLPPRARGGELLREVWLTPYTAETIAEDALRAGRGARLELKIAAPDDRAAVAGLQKQFAWLGAHGVELRVRPYEPGKSECPDAAA